MTIKAKMMKVTPKKAEEWLARDEEVGNKNRCVSAAMVERYASDMGSGRWQTNGEPVIFNGTALLDGQHRLHAVVKAGVPVDMLVVTGVEQDAFRTIDSGRARTFGHVLAAQGYAYATSLANAVAFLCVYDQGGSFTYSGKSLTKPTLEACLSRHPGIVASVEYASGFPTPLFSIASLAFAHYVFSKKNKAEADQFVRDLATGDGVKATSPAGMLRSRMLKEKTSAVRRLDRRVVVYFLFRTWNAFRSGEKLTVLRPPHQDDPRGLSVDLPSVV